MTVFRPSLPPDCWTRTRMVSLPGGAARAVSATNPGTTGASATSDEPFSVRVRNCRRVNMTGLRGFGRAGSVRDRRFKNSGPSRDRLAGSRQLELRHRQDRVDGLAGAAVEQQAARLALG